jgi:hypothetical protein
MPAADKRENPAPDMRYMHVTIDWYEISAGIAVGEYK